MHICIHIHTLLHKHVCMHAYVIIYKVCIWIHIFYHRCGITYLKPPTATKCEITLAQKHQAQQDAVKLINAEYIMARFNHFILILPASFFIVTSSDSIIVVIYGRCHLNTDVSDTIQHLKSFSITHTLTAADLTHSHLVGHFHISHLQQPACIIHVLHINLI